MKKLKIKKKSLKIFLKRLPTHQKINEKNTFLARTIAKIFFFFILKNR
jgi:hypothetical protein